MRPFVALLPLLAASSLSAYEVKSVALPPATMEELARVPVTPQAGEHRERPRLQRVTAFTANAIRATVVIAPEASAPPPLTRTFQDATDPLPGAHEGYDPPHASGAVS